MVAKVRVNNSRHCWTSGYCNSVRAVPIVVKSTWESTVSLACLYTITKKHFSGATLHFNCALQQGLIIVSFDNENMAKGAVVVIIPARFRWSSGSFLDEFWQVLRPINIWNASVILLQYMLVWSSCLLHQCHMSVSGYYEVVYYGCVYAPVPLWLWYSPLVNALLLTSLLFQQVCLHPQEVNQGWPLPFQSMCWMFSVICMMFCVPTLMWVSTLMRSWLKTVALLTVLWRNMTYW